MKISFCFFLCCLFFSGHAYSQADTLSYFRIDSVPNQGILLDKAWRVRVDNPAEGTDSPVNKTGWKKVDPTTDIHYYPEIRNSRVWLFRLELQLDSSLINKPLSLVMTQKGASEIYLNGKLLARYGKVSSDPSQLLTHDPKNRPVTFHFTGTTHQVIEIRYVLGKNTPYFSSKSFEGNGIFLLKIEKPENSYQAYVKPLVSLVAIWSIQTGIYLLLTIIHLFFFIYYPERKVNLYFSIFTFSYAITFILVGYDGFIHSMTMQYLADLLFAIAALTADILIILSIYKLFDLPVDNYLRSVVIICGLGVPFYLVSYEYGGSGILIGFILSCFGAIRAAILAMRRKKTGGAEVLWGEIFSLLFFILAIVSLSISDTKHSFSYYLAGQICYALAFLCPPAFISILLAREFAQNNITLKNRLIEVESLSKRTIAQEMEKQEILARQNITLEQQVQERTSSLSQTLKELKETQNHLIHSEKMASLGELTAGIAHEIQNPLNFVNNFSDLNAELIEELSHGIENKGPDQIKTMLKDIEENERKITHHGKRAGAIVKSMLQHSQVNIGKKEMTDINALVEEYLKLSYHGFKSRDENFSAVIETKYAPDAGKIPVVAADIGRVLVNLFNNAFYTTREKKSRIPDNFEPVVSVVTKKIGTGVEISVRDNGSGIPQNLHDKIFQPFFTTKPTGQGIGLGLSMSYDIIKAHRGEIRLHTSEGEYAEFTISIPAG